MNLTVKAAKSNFFDRKTVMLRVGDARRKVLSKAGAFVRTRAKSSIRSRRAISRPGSPPSSHKGLLKQFLFFAYDEARGSVVIGPAKIKAGRIPETLEYGGVEQGDGRVISIPNAVGRDAVTGRFVSGGRVRIKLEGQIHYAARPFMGPALEAEAPNFAGLWKDSVR